MNSRYRKHYVLLIALSIYYGIGFGVFVSGFGLFLTPISQTLQVPYVQVSAASTVRMIVGTVSTAAAGRLVSRVSFHRLLTVITLVMTAGAALTASASNIWMLYLASAMMGIGAGFGVYTIVPTVLNQWFERPSGYIGLATGVGAAMGIAANVILSSIINGAGWRTAYWLCALLSAVVSLPLSLFFIRLRPQDMGTTMMPASHGTAPVQSQPVGSVGLTNGQARHTLVYWLIALSFLSTTLVSGMYSQISTAMYSIGLQGVLVGVIAAAYQGGTMLYNLSLGALCNRFHPGAVMAGGAICVGLGGVGLFLFPSAPFACLLLFAVLLGGGRSLELICGPALVRLNFGRKECNAIFADLHAVMMLCSSMTAVLFGQIYTSTGSFSSVYLLLIAAVILMVVLLTLVRLCQAKRSSTPQCQ